MAASAPFAPVDAGRKALAGRSDFPWYDAGRDDLRRFDVEPPKDLENRHSKWQTKPLPTSSMPQWLWTVLEVLGWILLAAVLALLAAAFVKAYLMDASLPEPVAGDIDAPAAIGASDRVENLPFALDADQSDLLAEARRCYEAGDFARAMILLYSYELLQLDKHQWIRLTKGKTNRQYLREVRRQPQLRQFLERSMVAFEDVFFGRHALERERFESCWNGLGDFRRLLEQPAS